MAVSRFHSRAGCYVYGKLRVSDFLPVGPEREDEVLERGYLSVSSDDEEGEGLEHAFAEQSDEEYEADADDYGTVTADFD